MDLSPYKTRTRTIDGIAYVLMTNVVREAAGWRVSIERVDAPRKRNFFGDRMYGGTQAALDAAPNWLVAQKVRRPYEGIDLTREPCRKIELRRISHVADGDRLPRYELRIYASKGAWQRPWMSIYLGNVGTMTQQGIRDAIAVLHGRWFEYRRQSVLVGNAAALELDYSRVEPAPKAAFTTRLLIRDVLAWNGKGTGVTYPPKPDADAERPANSEVRRQRRHYRASRDLQPFGWQADQAAARDAADA